MPIAKVEPHRKDYFRKQIISLGFPLQSYQHHLLAKVVSQIPDRSFVNEKMLPIVLQTVTTMPLDVVAVCGLSCENLQLR